MAALPPAGVSLEAKGFQEYIKRLDQIDKQQKEVFDQQFKGTNKSYAQIQKAARDYERQLKKTAAATEKAEKEQKEYNERLKQSEQQQKSFNRTLALAGAGLALRELVQFGKESVALAEEQRRVEGQLAATIRSTGAAAGLSSREIKNLAGELQGLTNFGDEATIAGANLLLTFTNIGRDVFPDALRATLDVSTAMGSDLRTAAIQVGKALNDPVRGIGALSEAGIQFSNEQRELITTLVETGRTAEAQTLILQELNKQFGGSAEAAREAGSGLIPLSNSFGDLQEQIGFLIIDLGKASGVTESLTGLFDNFGAAIRGARADLGLGDTADAIAGVELEIRRLEQARDSIEAGGGALTSQFLEFIGVIDRTKDVAVLNEELQRLNQELTGLQAQAAAEDVEELADAQANATVSADLLGDELEDNTDVINALSNAIKQAEQLQLSFARAQEDAARRAARQVVKLEQRQAKDRERLLKDQQRALDEFEENRREQIAKAEADIVKAEKRIAEERKRAAQRRLDDQRKLQRQLRQEQERFNLSQLQSERRFNLDERRLRAAGDILAIQQLREDRELERQEEKENFDLSQRQTEENAKEQMKIEERQREADLQQKITDLKVNLEEQRAELLAGFDEQLEKQRQAQREQRTDLQINLAEQEQDRRISQQRQIEDLGRSLADQKDITQEGATAIAGELETAFGQEGIADLIISGFTMRTESEFTGLFEDVEDIIISTVETTARALSTLRDVPLVSLTGAISGLPQPDPIVERIPITGIGQRRRRQHGGPFGANEPIVVGEAGPELATFNRAGVILSNHQAFGGSRLQTISMAAPIIPSQVVSVEMSGGFSVQSEGSLSQAAEETLTERVIDNFEIAINRLARRNN